MGGKGGLLRGLRLGSIGARDGPARGVRGQRLSLDALSNLDQVCCSIDR